MSGPAQHDGEVAKVKGPPELTMPAAPDPRLDQMFPRLSPEEIDRISGRQGEAPAGQDPTVAVELS
jgi:hypothetical protein